MCRLGRTRWRRGSVDASCLVVGCALLISRPVGMFLFSFVCVDHSPCVHDSCQMASSRKVDTVVCCCPRNLLYDHALTLVCVLQYSRVYRNSLVCAEIFPRGNLHEDSNRMVAYEWVTMTPPPRMPSSEIDCSDVMGVGGGLFSWPFSGRAHR